MISPSRLLNGVGCYGLAHEEREKGIRWALAVGDSNYVIGIGFLFLSLFSVKTGSRIRKGNSGVIL